MVTLLLRIALGNDTSLTYIAVINYIVDKTLFIKDIINSSMHKAYFQKNSEDCSKGFDFDMQTICIFPQIATKLA